MKVPSWISYITIVLSVIAGVAVMLGHFLEAFWTSIVWMYGTTGYFIGRVDQE